MAKHPGGRPTKYNEDKLAIARDYVAKTDMPFIEELAGLLDVTSDTVRNWEERDEEFLLTIKKLEQKQKLALMKGGISKQFNNVMCIFLLKANHGLIEAEKQIHTFENIDNLPKIFYPLKDEE